jgi:hypothetical protein
LHPDDVRACDGAQLDDAARRLRQLVRGFLSLPGQDGRNDAYGGR